MAVIAVRCPDCNSDQVVKRGKTGEGKQRYLCRNDRCPRTSFILDYRYRGWLPEIKAQMVDMALNGSGIRDISRVLKVSTSSVIKALKKKASGLEPVNHGFLAARADPEMPVILRHVEDVEADEPWAFVGKKKQPRWLWQALDHSTGTVLAYVFGRREDRAFPPLKALLEPFGVRHYLTDGWGAYQRHLARDEHLVGKPLTPQLARKHLTLRTRIKRLARQTICFSRSVDMHDIVIGLFINRIEFRRCL